MYFFLYKIKLLTFYYMGPLFLLAPCPKYFKDFRRQPWHEHRSLPTDRLISVGLPTT
ncbi:hypothetical protein HanIR_Chr16g0828191 [Helianthus annuus]|nr:hypothetical protein HanIR_Chr16g0828191 [Helianthus annuus]